MRSRFGRSVLCAIMSIVLAVGLLPLPAYAGDSKLLAVQGVDSEGSPCAVLYKNGDLVIQSTAEPDGGEGHAASDVVEAYKNIDEYVEFADEEGYTFYNPAWFDRADEIVKVWVEGSVPISTLSGLFIECRNLVSADLSGLQTGAVEDMDNLFNACESLKTVNLSGIDTSNVTNMTAMFLGCSSLKSVDVSGFDTSRVTQIGSMFSQCEAITVLDLSTFDMSNVEWASEMFYLCSSLSVLDISSWDTNGIGKDALETLFEDCDSLSSLKIGAKTKLYASCGLPEGSWTFEDGQTAFSTTDEFIAAIGSSSTAGTWTFARPDNHELMDGLDLSSDYCFARNSFISTSGDTDLHVETDYGELVRGRHYSVTFEQDGQATDELSPGVYTAVVHGIAPIVGSRSFLVDVIDPSNPVDVSDLEIDCRNANNISGQPGISIFHRVSMGEGGDVATFDLWQDGSNSDECYTFDLVYLGEDGAELNGPPTDIGEHVVRVKGKGLFTGSTDVRYEVVAWNDLSACYLYLDQDDEYIKGTDFDLVVLCDEIFVPGDTEDDEGDFYTPARGTDYVVTGYYYLDEDGKKCSVESTSELPAGICYAEVSGVGSFYGTTSIEFFVTPGEEDNDENDDDDDDDDDSENTIIDYPVNGTWGKNLTWELAESGCLTISGEGRMDRFKDGSEKAWLAPAYREAITSIVIEPGVTSLSSNAFSECRNILSVEIPEGVTAIDNAAFYNCESLTSIELPDSLRSFDAGAFFGCGSLETVAVAEGNGPYHADSNGALYRESKLLYYPEGAQNERFDIEEGTTSCELAVIDNRALKLMRIPSSLEEMDVFLFGLPSLDRYEVDEGNGLYFIDESGVLYQKEGEGITLVSYPQGKQNDSYSVLNGTRFIGPSAFSMYGACGSGYSAAHRLKAVDLGDTVEVIEQNAFLDCLALETLEIPASCTTISDNAVFRGCVSLRAFKVADGNKRYRSDEFGALYDAVVQELLRFPLGSDLETYAISPGTLAIEDSAFAYEEWDEMYPYDEDADVSAVPNLKHVIIPSSVKSVGWGVFDMSYLDGITVLSGDAEFDDAIGNFVNHNPIVRCIGDSPAQAWAVDAGFEVKVVSEPDFEIAGIAERYDYTGSAIVPDMQVSRDGSMLEDADYGVLYAGNVSGPIAAMLVYGKGIYAGYASEVTFGISQDFEEPKLLDISDADIKIDSRTYDGTPLAPTAKVRLGPVTLIAGVDYSLEYGECESVGSYSVLVKGMGLYKGSQECVFRIEPRSVTVTAQPASKVYGSGDPELLAVVEGVVGDDTVEYTLSRAAGEDAGEYAITASGEAEQGNYSVSFEPATLTVKPAELTITAQNRTKVFGAGDPQFEAVVTGYQFDDESAEGVVDYRFEREPGEVVGEYAIAPVVTSISGNYTAKVVAGKLTITKAYVVVKVPDMAKTYGQRDPDFEVEYVRHGAVDEDFVPVVNLFRALGENVGSYVVRPFGASEQGGYDIVFEEGSLTITPAKATVKARDLSKEYGDSEPELTADVTGLYGKDSVMFELARVAGEAPGSYAITASGEAVQGNYEVEFSDGTFTVERKSVKGASLKLSKTDFVYSGKVQKPTVTVTVDGEKLQSGNDYTLKYSNAKSAKPGIYKVWVEGVGNYTGASAKTDYTIAMLANPVKVTAQSPNVSLAKMKKAKLIIAAKNAFAVAGNKGGKATYKKVSGDKAISVAADGKVTISKGAKKGTHSAKVKVSFAAKGSYDAATKTVTLKVKVK